MVYQLSLVGRHISWRTFISNSMQIIHHDQENFSCILAFVPFFEEITELQNFRVKSYLFLY